MPNRYWQYYKTMLKQGDTGFMQLYRNLLVCLTLLLLSGPGQAAVGYKVGDSAPEFALKDLQGKVHTLSELRKQRHVFLVFWATECVYCYAHIKDFNQIQTQYPTKLKVAAINIAGEYDQEVADYVKDNGVKYLTLSDRLKNIDVSEAYNVLGTPTLVLISPDGKVLYNGHKIPDLQRWVK